MCRRKCDYRGGTISGVNVDVGEHPCDYGSRTGKSRTKTLMDQQGKKRVDAEIRRLLECENCPFYKPIRQGRKGAGVTAGAAAPQVENRGGRRRTVDKSGFRELYDKGLNDNQMAKALGVTNTTVWQWRHENQLEPNGKRGGYREGKKESKKGSKRKYDYDEVRRLTEEGVSARAIAKQIGCHKCTVAEIRQKLSKEKSEKEQNT